MQKLHCKYSSEQWEKAKAAYLEGMGKTGFALRASEISGIGYGALRNRATLEKWGEGGLLHEAVERRIEEKPGLIADLSTAIKDWMEAMLGTVSRSIQTFEQIDAAGLPKTYPEAKIREETIAIHQDRVRKLFGLDQAGGEAQRTIGADWKPAKIIEVETPSTPVELGGEIKNPPPHV